jgi:hypothetical protein
MVDDGYFHNIPRVLKKCKRKNAFFNDFLVIIQPGSAALFRKKSFQSYFAAFYSWRGFNTQEPAYAGGSAAVIKVLELFRNFSF